MFKNYIYSNNNIIYSIVIPIYNQEEIIVKNLQSIIDNTLENFKIILILDYCFDNTEQNLIDFLNNYTNKPNLIQIR